MLRKALCPSAELAVPSGVNWKRFIRLAHEQGVVGVCFSAVDSLPAEQRPGFEELMDWIGRVEFQKKVYEKQRGAIAELAAFYSEHGIRMMLLKGYGLSLNYPTPELRPGGDIDVYLFGRQQEADALIAAKGIAVHSDNLHHSTFCYKGITIENHRTLMDQDNHKSNIRLEQLFQKFITQTGCVEIGENVLAPSPTLNAVYLLRHAGEHFATEEITLRHVLDLATFFQKHHNEVDWDTVLRIYREEHMMPFYNAIATICVHDLGFEASGFQGYLSDEKLADRVLADIFAQKEAISADMRGWKKIPYGWKKSLRWWRNRWKYRMVYRETMWESFLTLASHRLRHM